MSTRPLIWIVDHPGSGAPDRATLLSYAAAMNQSIAGDFAPVYRASATFNVLGDAKDLSPGDWLLGLFGSLDQADALGYHEPDEVEDLSIANPLVGIANPLVGKVCPVLDAQDGAALSQTIDHEAKELLRDLWCNAIATCADGRLAADECCDAVEQDAYMVDGVVLSNFVLPSWYHGHGSRFDFLGKLTAPITVTAGGYCQFYSDAAGWTQVTSALAPPRSYRRLDFNGRQRRRDKRSPAVVSR